MPIHPRSRLQKKHKRPYDMARVPTKMKHVKRIASKEYFAYLVKKYRKQIYWAIGIAIAIILLIPLFTYIYFAGDLKDKKTITNRSKTGLTLMDKDGKTFFTFYQPKAVTYVPLSDIPDDVQEAVIASEDKNFYTNAGFSVTGMGRAFIRNLMAGRIVEGGSTISQELVKIALLNSSRNVLRKYQELVLATELNRRFSKKDILEMYLNSVYFGEGAFGIENAAQAYFGIPAKELTLSQASMLIGLLPAPSAYSPISGSETKALQRQRTVLQEMVEEKYITPEQEEAALATPLEYDPAPQTQTNTLAPWFALYVKDLLIKKYGEERVIREGFNVKTTLNSEWQEYAERAVKNRIASLSWNKAGNGAAVALDPTNGNILVMVGSHDWNDDKWGKANMTLIPRQPGSSFKPIIYADAFQEKIITPATMLQDNPISYGDYKPLDYDKQFRGEVTARRALANSLNIPAVEVMDKVGVSNGIAQARKMGITTLKDNHNYGVSFVLGTAEIPLIEMTNAYGVFADQGIYHEPNAVLEIRNKYDEVVDTQTRDFWFYINPFNWFKTFTSNQAKSVLNNGAAFLISSILSDNRTRAEEFGGALTISRPAAVKTGTTEDYRDALTIGYTPSLVVGVWVGNNDNSPMDNVAGSLGAAPIWRNMMETFLLGTPVEQFIKPPDVVEALICPSNPFEKISTFSATKDFFIKGTEPSQDCADELTPSPTQKPSETPTPTPTNAAEPTPTPSPTPTQGVTPTPTPSPTPILP